MRTFHVDLGHRSYPISIGRGLISSAQTYAPFIHGTQVMVITNETIAPLYLDQVLSALADYETHSVVLPAGEKYKNVDIWHSVFDRLVAIPCNRQTTVVALGGGVIGDIAGFAAACYQRGIPLLQVPTTLLAQVDSSVGGKTGINHRLGKNMIGAFYQPSAVITDVDTLDTLSERELTAGIAEIIKYGLIRDREFFGWLEDNMNRLTAREPEALIYAIERSCQNKTEVVVADEMERGERALLNLGHTFGHAIETGIGYGEWLHGEAVAAGTAMAADLSCRLGFLAMTEHDRIRCVLSAARLPTAPPSGVSPEQFLRHMAVDKKAANGIIRLVLLRSIGDAFISADYPRSELETTLRHFQQRS